MLFCGGDADISKEKKLKSAEADINRFTCLKNVIKASDTEKKIYPQISKVHDSNLHIYIEENDDSKFSMQQLCSPRKTIKTRLQLHDADNIVFSSKFGST